VRVGTWSEYPPHPHAGAPRHAPIIGVVFVESDGEMDDLSIVVVFIATPSKTLSIRVVESPPNP
jgi:hypothetical protein